MLGVIFIELCAKNFPPDRLANRLPLSPMSKLSTDKYQADIKKAVKHFWKTRGSQKNSKTKKADQGNRGAVTGGKQLDGFVKLFVKVSKDLGVPKSWIHVKGNVLPGYFRPTKDWDFLIVTPNQELIAAIEFKSQVGSFGNNFNNRTEEALGNAVDLWTAYRERSFPQIQVPWIGYLMLAEKTLSSEKPVQVKEPHFKVRQEFRGTSYLERYVLLCEKLMLEKHYSHAALIWTDSRGRFGELSRSISIDSMLMSFMGHVQSKSQLFF